MITSKEVLEISKNYPLCAILRDVELAATNGKTQFVFSSNTYVPDMGGLLSLQSFDVKNVVEKLKELGFRVTSRDITNKGQKTTSINVDWSVAK